MDAERARALLLALPHVVETEQWGGLVYWVGDKAIGGKMFAMVNPDGAGEKPISYPAGQERFAELVEREGIVPAPYMARIFWVSAESWSVFRESEWRQELQAAHEMTLRKLTPRTQAVLAMPKAEQKRIVAEGRRRLAESTAAKAAAKVQAKTERPVRG